jgi:hypothetical protein
MSKRGLILSLIIMAAAGNSLFAADAYFLNSIGGDWSVTANWTALPHSSDYARIGSPPTSPSGAWATLDSPEPDIYMLVVGDASGTGRLDIANGAKLNIVQGWRAAIGAGSVANINVSGGIVIDGADPTAPISSFRAGAPTSQWGVDGTVNYTQTGGFVYTRQTHLAINPGSVVNIKVTGGTLDMGGIQAGDQDPCFMPTPVHGQLNITLDNDAYMILRVPDLTTGATFPSNISISLNGNAKLAVVGANLRADPTAGGKITSRGTLTGYYGTYAWPTTWRETLVFAQCNNVLPGDLNMDCTVDMRDVALFMQQWLLKVN